MNTKHTKTKYFVRIVHNDGKLSVLSYRDRTEWTKRTAEKHGSEFFEKHGLMTYIIQA